MPSMTELQATLALIILTVALVPVGVWMMRTAKRSKRAMAPLAGIMMLLGAFFTADPPPPPRTESIAREEEDEDGAADGSRPER